MRPDFFHAENRRAVRGLSTLRIDADAGRCIGMPVFRALGRRRNGGF